MPEPSRYAARREAGICTSCGRRKARKGKPTCGPCRRAMNDHAAALRVARIKRGACPLCGNKPERGKRHCPRHLETARRSNAQFRRRRKTA